MSNIHIKNLTFGYTTDNNVFENLNLSINSNWKLGLTGRNGQGKSTLFKLLLDKLEYSGSIKSTINFAYFPLQIDDHLITVNDLIYEYIGYEDGWKVQVELSKLGVEQDISERVLATLSGGEQTKLMLAILFAGDNQFPLIDEPTNHLDEYGREVVIKYLKTKSGYIVISHDLHFLDQTIDHVLAIERTDIKVYQLSMSAYLQQKQSIDNQNKANNLKLRSEIKRLEVAKRQTANWSDKKEASKVGDHNREAKPDRGYIGHKAAKMMKRSKVLEARQDKEIKEKRDLLKNIDISRAISCEPLYASKPLISITHLDLEQLLVQDLNFQIESGFVYQVKGKNGSGKTTLLSLLGCKQCNDHITYLSNLKLSTINQIEQNIDSTLVDYCKQQKIDLTQISTILINLGMNRKDFKVNLKGWSNGQLKKLAIAKSISTPAHLYIWDEPLNYLDIIARQQIIELIKNSNMTLIIVEHDKQIEQVVDQVIKL